MNLPERFSLHIDGSTHRVRDYDNAAAGRLEYLLRRLLRGEAVGKGAFDPYRLRVTIEPDTDQGDEE
mgnify:CR=1 FL=1